MAISSQAEKTSVIACSIIGMACWWPFFRNSFLGMILYGEPVGNDVSGLYFAAVVVLVAFSLAARFASKAIVAAFRSVPVAALVFAVLFLVSSIVLKSFDMRGFYTIAAAFSSVIFAVLSAGCLALYWFMVARKMPIDRALFVFVASFCFSFFIPYIAHFYGEIAMWWTNVASLAVSAACATGARVLLIDRGWGEGEEGFNRIYDANSREMVLVLVLFLVVGSVFRGVFSQGVLDYSPGAETEFRYIEALVSSLVVLVVSFFFASHRSFFTIVWMVFALMFLVGLLALSAFDTTGIEAGVSTVITARTFLVLLLWAVLAQDVRSRSDAEALKKVSTLFLLVEAIALFLTGVTTPLVSNLFWIESNSRTLSLWMAIILIVGSFVYLGRLVIARPSALRSTLREGAPGQSIGVDLGLGTPSSERTSAIPASSLGGLEHRQPPVEILALERGAQAGEAARRAACGRISRRFGLTERESDVLFAISQGHSVKKTAGMLFISTGTVQSHVKRLYRKMGCHSRQDVIDLVDNELQGE